MTETERCTITFSGRVQGVGFRITACQAAAGYPELTGWVRNEPDGSVRMVVEGDPKRIEACLADLRRRMARNITDERIDWSPATGEFTSFGVEY